MTQIATAIISGVFVVLASAIGYVLQRKQPIPLLSAHHDGSSSVQAKNTAKQRRPRFKIQLQLIRQPGVSHECLRRFGRVPEQADIARPGRGARVHLLHFSLTRPSSPRSSFTVRDYSVVLLNELKEPGDDFATSGFVLKVVMHRHERSMHLLRSIEHRSRASSCRVVLCSAQSAANDSAYVRCVTVTHSKSRTVSDSELHLRSSNSLMSGFPHEEFLRVDQVPPDAVWLICIPEPERPSTTALPHKATHWGACCASCRRCARKRQALIRRQGDPFPYRRVRNLYIALQFAFALMLLTLALWMWALSDLSDASQWPTAFTVTFEIGVFVFAVPAVFYLLKTLVLAAANAYAYWFRDRRYHRVLDGTLPWTATTTRSLTDGSYIRNGWTRTEWDAVDA